MHELFCVLVAFLVVVAQACPLKRGGEKPQENATYRKLVLVKGADSQQIYSLL
jgi:hypothetical protein